MHYFIYPFSKLFACGETYMVKWRYEREKGLDKYQQAVRAAECVGFGFFIGAVRELSLLKHNEIAIHQYGLLSGP